MIGRALSGTSGKDLFSQTYYSRQCGIDFESLDDAWQHYLKHGFANGHEPAKYFLSKWYRWQNPDSTAYPSVLDHFASQGQHRLIDPSPFVDLKLISQRTNTRTSIEAYHKLLEKGLTSCDGFFSSYGDLQQNQEKFRESLKLDLVQNKFADGQASQRKRLVWVQIGSGSEFVKWFDTARPRSWDLLCNWYNFDAVDLTLGEMSFAQRGTKFTGVAQVLRHYPHLLKHYEQVLFIDDDLVFEFSSVDRLFDIAKRENLGLFQAALSEDSFGIWPDTKKATNKEWLPFNTVEIMMPGFSMPFLMSTQEIFDQSVSGFGIDLALGKAAASAGFKAGVVFDVRVKHLKPIDDAGGTYYEFMRNNGINPKLELWKLVTDYDCDLDIKAL